MVFGRMSQWNWLCPITSGTWPSRRAPTKSTEEAKKGTEVGPPAA